MKYIIKTEVEIPPLAEHNLDMEQIKGLMTGLNQFTGFLFDSKLVKSSIHVEGLE